MRTFSHYVPLLVAVLACGCSREQVVPPVGSLVAAFAELGEGRIRVHASQSWNPTGVHVKAGDAISIAASGNVNVDDTGRGIGPAGTYHHRDEVVGAAFPAAATADGPAPCYGLIARVGDGPPFPVGSHYSWFADRSGEVQLGINDFDTSDNVGAWDATLTTSASPHPIGHELVLDERSSAGRPIPGASVVVFYVDGLRPDVVREMAALGHLPNIRRLFVDGGTWFQNGFTAFPSDTITSNGTMWTGVFSDRHGLKGQVRFSRRTLHSDSYLEPMGPNRSSRLLAPSGVDAVFHESTVESIRLVAGEGRAKRFDRGRTTRAAPLYDRLRSRGEDWSTGVLPVMTETPPLLWTKSMARFLPYFQSHRAWEYVDDANAHYARRQLLQRNSPVTIVWLPETDSVSHKRSRGQFGLTRRTIAQADQLIGEIVDELEARGRLESTYLWLVSDHGHHGGRRSYLSHFDLANEFFHAPREIDENGDWTSGGLGLSVRQHRFWNRHEGDSSRSFVFVDGESDGAARVFLPKRAFDSRDWSGPNRPGDLLAYSVSGDQPPVNLVETLLEIRARHGSGRVERPVDLVMLALSETSVLIANGERGAAVVDRRRDLQGKWEVRYRVVGDLRSNDQGGIDFDVLEHPESDPLRLLETLPGDVLGRYFDERTWLRLTAGTPYPDGVVTLTRHVLWDETIADRRLAHAPDFVVTAAPGWYFGRESSPGTMHGYPFRDAVTASMFVSGPNVRRGARVVDPARLADLTPTILDMIGHEALPDDFDGRPLRVQYESSTDDEYIVGSPVFWGDVDTKSADRLEYRPLEPYAQLPFAANRPFEATDLNNIAYNGLTVLDWNVFRLLDDAFVPVTNGGRNLTRGVEAVEDTVRVREGWAGQAVEALNVGGSTVGDYTWTSAGNLKRIDGVVDWMQARGGELDSALAGVVGRRRLPGSVTLERSVDGLQAVTWELYRLTQRLMVQIVDEAALNGIEDGVARTINTFRRTPSEVRISPTIGRAQSPDALPPRSASDEAGMYSVEDKGATRSTAPPLSAEARKRLQSDLEAAVERGDAAVEKDAKSVAAYSARGDARFFLGRFEEAVADYDKMVELDPRRGNSHWRRGIARFYAGDHDGAAEQFEAYHTFDNVDRENGIWRYLSQHRAKGRKKAREGLLKYEKTDREPFPDVYRLFAGEITPEKIVANIEAAKVTENEKRSRRFYAHLYIGLNHAVEGRDAAALEHLAKATANDWPRTAGYGPHYMWQVGRLHYELLAEKKRNEQPE